MIEVNKKFVSEMQKRLDEKEDEKTDYRNDTIVPLWKLWRSLLNNANIPQMVLEKDKLQKRKVFRDETRKELVDIANFCWMIWERLGDYK